MDTAETRHRASQPTGNFLSFSEQSKTPTAIFCPCHPLCCGLLFPEIGQIEFCPTKGRDPRTPKQSRVIELAQNFAFFTVKDKLTDAGWDPAN